MDIRTALVEMSIFMVIVKMAMPTAVLQSKYERQPRISYYACWLLVLGCYLGVQCALTPAGHPAMIFVIDGAALVMYLLGSTVQRWLRRQYSSWTPTSSLARTRARRCRVPVSRNRTRRHILERSTAPKGK